MAWTKRWSLAKIERQFEEDGARSVAWSYGEDGCVVVTYSEAAGVGRGRPRTWTMDAGQLAQWLLGEEWVVEHAKIGRIAVEAEATRRSAWVGKDVE